MIELMMSTHPGFVTLTGFHWFLTPDLWQTTHVLSWLAQGLVLSFVAYLFIDSQRVIAEGLRFGLITGIVFVLLVLFNMMFQLDHTHYAFFQDSLMTLMAWQVFGLTLSGWAFGLIYALYEPQFPQIKTLWSLA